MHQPQAPTSQLRTRRWWDRLITVIVVVVGAWWLILGDWVIDQSLQPLANVPIWRFIGHGIILAVIAVLVYRLLGRRGRPDPTRCSSCVAFQSFSTSADGMFINAPDGRFLEVNEAGCRMLGYERDELLGMTIADVATPESLEQDPLRLDPSVGALPRVAQREVRRKDGSTIHVEVAAELLPDGTVLGAVRDLTERRRIESRLAEQTRRFETMLDNLLGMAYRCRNDEHWTFLFVSDGCAELTGYKKEDLLYNRTVSYDSVVHPDDRQLVREAVERGLGNDRPFEMIYRIVRADGSTRWVQERGQRVEVAGSDEPLLEGLITDVTSQKLAEAELRTQNERERLLFRELDHRVRNNLASLISLVDVTRSEARDIESFGEAVAGRIRTLALVHEFLSHSRWAPVELRELIRALEPADRRGRLDLVGDVEFIAPRQTTALGMVIHELMTNSVKYGALGVDEGRVRIAWSPITMASGDRRVLEITWHEQDGPLIDRDPVVGVGTGLVSGLCRSELRGEAAFAYPKEGATHRLVITLDEITAPEQTPA